MPGRMNSMCFQNANVALGLMATMNRGFSDGKCVFFQKEILAKKEIQRRSTSASLLLATD